MPERAVPEPKPDAKRLRRGSAIDGNLDESSSIAARTPGHSRVNRTDHALEQASLALVAEATQTPPASREACERRRSESGAANLHERKG